MTLSLPLGAWCVVRFAGLTLFGLLLTTTAYAQDYLMVGTYDVPQPGKTIWCANTAMETVPLKNKEQYTEAKKAFHQAHKGKSPSTSLLTPNSAAVVVRYKRFLSGFECEREVHALYTGSDVEHATREMERRRKANPREFRSEPQVVFTWRGGEYKSVVKRNIDGVDLTFTSRSKGGKTVVVAQGKNTHRDKAAVVVFSGQGVTSKPIVLQPGMGFTQPVGKVEQFEIEVGLREPQPTEKGAVDKAMDFVKSKVKEQMTTKDGKMKPSGGVAGPRG